MDRLPPEMRELAAFLGFFFDRYMNNRAVLRPEIHPLNVLAKLVQQHGPEKAMQGLRMAVNDCLEASHPWSPTQVREADTALRAGGIITLSELRRRFSKRLATVLKRGRITAEVDYYMVVGILSDRAVPTEEAVVLQRLVDAYEAAAVCAAGKRASPT